MRLLQLYLVHFPLDLYPSTATPASQNVRIKIDFSKLSTDSKDQAMLKPTATDLKVSYGIFRAAVEVIACMKIAKCFFRGMTVFLILLNSLFDQWEQGWRSGESICLPPMRAGIDARIRPRMWVEFVGSLLCTEWFFPGYSGFSLSSKTNS